MNASVHAASNVEAFTDLGDAPALPRADAASARAVNRLYANARAHDFTLGGETYRLHWLHRPAMARTVRDSYRFRLGTHVGHLGLDRRAVQVLLVEERVESLPADLRYILLADALHPLIDALEKTLRLHFEWQPVDTEALALRHADKFACDPERAVFFRADAAGGGHSLEGFVQFEDAEGFELLAAHRNAPPAAAAPAPAVDTRFDGLRVPLDFRIGSTPIQLRELRAIRPGDIVGIEQWTPSDAAIVVSAQIGRRAGFRLFAFAEGSRITVQQSVDSAMKQDPTPPLATAEPAASLPIDRLDALEVMLRFEVGDIELSLGDLKSLRAGHVFDLGQPLNRSPIRILAHGNVLGKGYLVAVGDRLGVRVSEFAPGEV